MITHDTKECKARKVEINHNDKAYALQEILDKPESVIMNGFINKESDRSTD